MQCLRLSECFFIAISEVAVLYLFPEIINDFKCRGGGVALYVYVRIMTLSLMNVLI